MLWSDETSKLEDKNPSPQEKSWDEKLYSREYNP